MAERFPEVALPIDPVEARINAKFDQLFLCLNRRREQLIAEHRGRQEERRGANTTRIQTLQQLSDSRASLQTEMKENLLHSMRERMVEEIETRMGQLEVPEREVQVLFECDTRQLQETISALGQLAEREIATVPNYPALLQPRISVGKKGTGLGEFEWPHGIAFDEKTQLIYVADGHPILTNGSIKVFSVTGEYIDTFCKGIVGDPAGIAIRGDEVYVSDRRLHSIYHFKLPGFQLVTRVGKLGTGIGEFNSPNDITVAPNGFVFVADTGNNRIVVMTDNLNFLRTISHASMTRPYAVKLLDNKVYVFSFRDNRGVLAIQSIWDSRSRRSGPPLKAALGPHLRDRRPPNPSTPLRDNPCIHVFSQSGEKLRSLITCGEQGNEQVKEGYFFCFDKQENILISDYSDNSIKVFSQEGALLHTLGKTQEEEKRINPKGIVVTDSNTIICTSYNTMFGLHIFS